MNRTNRRNCEPRRRLWLCGHAALLAMLVGLAVPLGGPVRAATFPGLYTVTIEADRTAADARAAAIGRAMQVLLTRVTGLRQAASAPELQGLVASAERYITSYAELDQDHVRVGFNANRVVNELTALEWPIWGAERPLSVLWVAVDFENGQRALLSADENAAEVPPDLEGFLTSIREEMLRVADERGLPVVLPLLDVEDFQSVSFAEVWGGFDPLIERASVRYGADVALVSRISLTEFGLDVRWTMLSGGRSQSLRTSTLQEGIDWLADRFAAEFSMIGGAHSTRIAIEGVRSLDDYGRVMSRLESISILETIDVESLSEDLLTLRVVTRGDDRVLERVLTLDGLLQVAETRGSGFGAALRFRAVGSSEFLR